MTAFRSSLLAVFALVPAIALAAPVKKAHKTVTTTTVTTDDAAPAAAPQKHTTASDNQSTLFGSTGGNMMSALKGLSVYAAYDFADTAESSDSRVSKADTEKAFNIGAMYETPQFAQGIAAEGGLEYDFARAVKNTQPQVKFSQILPYVELTAHLTPMFKLMGGLNYNFPSVDNLPSQITYKGALGYQFGASVAFTPHIALDVRYRSVQYDRTQTADANQGIPAFSDTLKENGFVMGGRYIF